MKKSEVHTQIFVYLIAMVVISLVLLYGYNAIKGFMLRSDEVNLVQFKTDFINAIDAQSHEYQSVIRKTLFLPPGYTTLMIIDSELWTSVNGAASLKNFMKDGYPLVLDSWISGVDKNVFLIGKNKMESFYAGKIIFSQIEPPPIPPANPGNKKDNLNCWVPSSKKYYCIIIDAPDREVEIKLTGLGGKTMVELWK
jgi:hypothetical protein